MTKFPRPYKIPERRAVSEIPVSPHSPNFIADIVAEIHRIEWPYTKAETMKVKGVEIPIKDLLRNRDQGLAAYIALIGPRITEALKRKRKDFTVEPDRILVAAFLPGKRGDMRKNLYLPRTGPRAPLTEIFLKWLEQVPSDPEAFVFPSAKPFGFIHWDRRLERARAHWIMKSTIGKFPHWYRSVCETYIGKLVFKSDAFKLRKYMGVKRLESVVPYVNEPFQADLEDFDKR